MLNFVCLHFVKAQTLTTAQTDSLQHTRAQNLFAELYGAGLTLSFNYDTRFSNRRDGFGARVGIGFDASSSPLVTTLPFQVNYLLGKKDKFFEVGVGATHLSGSHDDLPFSNSDTNHPVTIGTFTFGYRYQPLKGGFTFRASFNPIFNSANFFPFGGVSFGYTF